MDARRFDALTRSLAAPATRRSVLGTLLAATGALLLPRTGVAGCIKPGQPCEQGDACCDGHTCSEAVCDCPSGIFDAVGRCAPPGPGTVPCLLELSPCATNEDCCVDAGLTCQEGTCLPAVTVSVECSEVGGPCGVGRTCCAAPATTCSGDGLCVCTPPLIPDRTGLVCVAVCSYPDEPCDEASPCCEGAGTCVDGVCRCPDELRPCGATCIDPTVRYRRDGKNCGARGNACADGQVCCEGVCVAEDTFTTDVDRCGGCCGACHPWEVCCDGVCDQPFFDPVRAENVCCAPEQVCAPGDGTELCCLEDEVCHNGGCCFESRVCGDTCCADGESCVCGVCVAELPACEEDGDCCGGRCVDGVCCPATDVCPGEDGAEFCCGIGLKCGPEPGTCVGDFRGQPTAPIRTPRP